MILLSLCSLNSPFHLGFRETPVFLPGTFRDCGLFEDGSCFRTSQVRKVTWNSLPTWTPAQIVTFLQFCFRKPFREASGGNVSHFFIFWYHDWGLSGLLWLLSRLRSNLTKEKLKPKKGFRFAFRETLLFLPGTFRDCGVLTCSKTHDFLKKKHRQIIKATLLLFHGTG